MGGMNAVAAQLELDMMLRADRSNHAATLRRREGLRFGWLMSIVVVGII